MKFRSELSYKTSLSELKESDVLLFLGSCFADNIGAKFSQLQGKAVVQPMGTMYNPLSIAYCLKKDKFYEEELIKTGDGYFGHWQVHSSLNKPSRAEALRAINTAHTNLRKTLESASTLFITFGTATVYTSMEQQTVVGNCHKLPAKNFLQTRLTTNQIVAEWKSVLDTLQRNYPTINQVCFTVSPVRYIKDGLVENNRSKATLILAIDELCANYSFAHYYPAFELVQDDLRDYRFYKEDLAHPNGLAIDYVWQHFSKNCCSKALQTKFDDALKLLKLQAHKPQNVEIHKEQLNAVYKKWEKQYASPFNLV